MPENLVNKTKYSGIIVYVRHCLIDALNDALHALPAEQRRVVEAQVFGGLTFREIAQATGESINTLTARKPYAIRNLSRALRHCDR
jgi:DNA-directed RNA polymerase specialized sigma24 family protein